MRRWLTVVLALVVDGVLGGCSSSGSDPSSGQSITLYSGQHQQTVNGLVTAFEKQTGITVNVRNDDEDTLANLISEEAWQQHGRQPSLLLECARADASDGAYWHCLAVAAEAARSSPDSLDTVCMLAWALDATYGYGPALQVLASLPAAARQTAEARVAAGTLHPAAGNYALAVAAYGDPRDLDRFDR